MTILECILNIMRTILTAPVGAGWCQTISTITFKDRAKEKTQTTNKEIFVGAICSRVYNRLDPVQACITLREAYHHMDRMYEVMSLTGKHCLARGSNSCTGTNRSETFGGMGVAGGIITSSNS